MRKYTNPEAHGYLMEAAACKKVLKELTRISEKLQRAVAREEAARQKDLETALQFRSEREIQDAYGFDCITEAQYDLYMQIFEEGQQVLEKREKTVTELALSIVSRIISDISLDCSEWEFCALTPKEQAAAVAKAKQQREAWQARIAAIRAKCEAVDFGKDPMTTTETE